MVFEHATKRYADGVEAVETDPAGVAPSAEGVQVVARLAAASAIKQGREAQLWVDTSRLHLFDHETGRSLLTRESSRLEVPEFPTASRRRLIAQRADRAEP